MRRLSTRLRSLRAFVKPLVHVDCCCANSIWTRQLCYDHTIHRKRPPLGSRYLKDESHVFEFNNWDNVVWDEEQELEAIRMTEEQIKHPVDQQTQEKYETEAGQYWDSFYEQHQNRFFKDRHWLFTEFPELSTSDRQGEITAASPEESQTNSDTFPGDSANIRMLEVGCGVGNTVFPVLQTNNNPDLMMYCCDFSSTAIQIVKDHTDYNPDRCHAFVYDLTSQDPFPFPENSLDIIIMIFVLSAIKPDKMESAVNRLAKHLKPGGVFLFRDYGRYDMAQLRFKKGRCLSENFYVRGDGTRVYFFTQDDLRKIFSGAGLIEKQNLIDRRLQVNRGRQLKMYRVWIQCKYRKPGESVKDGVQDRTIQDSITTQQPSDQQQRPLTSTCGQNDTETS